MNPSSSALLTDLYQMNMIQAYLDHDQTKTAVFEFFVRKLPARRDFLIAAGLEQAIQFIENMRFSREEIEWLASTRRFEKSLLDRLSDFRFTGDVHAVREGRVFSQTSRSCALLPRCRRPSFWKRG
jgi:nicotinate phosphoribosyltransferase